MSDRTVGRGRQVFRGSCREPGKFKGQMERLEMQGKAGRRVGELAEEPWGCDRGDYRGKDYREVNPGASAQLWKSLIVRALDGRKRIHTSEHVSCTWLCVGNSSTAIV